MLYAIHGNTLCWREDFESHLLALNAVLLKDRTSYLVSSMETILRTYTTWEIVATYWSQQYIAI